MDKWMKVFQKVLAYPRNYITSLYLHFTSSKFGINSNFVEKHRTSQCIVVLLFWRFLDFLHWKTIESFCVWVSKCWTHFTGDTCSWNTCFLVQALKPLTCLPINKKGTQYLIFQTSSLILAIFEENKCLHQEKTTYVNLSLPTANMKRFSKKSIFARVQNHVWALQPPHSKLLGQFLLQSRCRHCQQPWQNFFIVVANVIISVTSQD